MLNLINIFLQIILNNDAEYDEHVETITISSSNISSVKTILQENSINFSNLQNDRIQIEINDLNFKFFWTDSEFRNKISTVSNFKELNYLIINKSNNNNKIYLFESKHEYNFFVIKSTYFFSNTFAYLDLLAKLKSKSNNTHNDFHFIDNYDSSSDIFLITSPKEPGKLTIQIPNETIEPDEKIDYKKELSFLDSVFEPNNKNLPIFLKTEIFSNIKLQPETQRMQVLYCTFREIYNLAQKNFEVFLNELSIDDLKQNYDEYKKKYFELVSDVMGKITNQFIALPITIATTAFAIIRVEESLFASILIIVALCGTSVYLSFLLLLYKTDLNYFSRSVENDYNKIVKSPFFIKYPEEIEDFKFIRKNLSSKINKFKILTYIYFIMMWLFNTLLIYLLFYIQSKGSFSIISFSLVAVLINVILLYFFEKKE